MSKKVPQKSEKTNTSTITNVLNTNSTKSSNTSSSSHCRKLTESYRASFHRKIKIGVCTLNQLSMDFENNKQRIIKSIEHCIRENCSLRVGPELEICGYSCEDHFLERDTQIHCWEVIRDILETGLSNNLLINLGTIVEWNGALYNCTIFLYKKKVIMIRPKSVLADDGNYRESRWFTAWAKGFNLFNFTLPNFIQEITGQQVTKIGIGIISFNDCSIASEICEESWVSDCPSNQLCLAGAEIIINNSGSLYEYGKHKIRTDLLNISSYKNGGCYIYANLSGCDGGRLYFDGGSFVSLNGSLIAEGKQSKFIDIDVLTPIVDLDEIAKKRVNSRSRCNMSSDSQTIENVIVNDFLCNAKFQDYFHTEFLQPTYLKEEQSLIQSITGWLFDYLRKSGASGFFLPLSGGSDSGCVAVLVGYMCRTIFKEIHENNNNFVLSELRKIVKNNDYYPISEKDIAGKILFTAYLSTKHNSSSTRASAKSIAEEIGSNHLEVEIDKVYEEFQKSLLSSINVSPKFISEGGSYSEDLALQNLQSRIRMVCSYLLAQIASLTGKTDLKGFLIMLASGNLDEAQLGYLTKYDCSSGDINPIGSLSKIKLKVILNYFKDELGYSSLEALLKLTPSAELRPLDNKNPSNNQTDEADLGFTYEEINTLNDLRQNKRCGPYSMFKFLRSLWKEREDSEIRDKVKKYFFKYSINRHKVTVLTPSVYLNSNCNDDNRYDLRPFLYNPDWSYQFEEIDTLICKVPSKKIIENPNNLSNSSDYSNNNLELKEEHRLTQKKVSKRKEGEKEKEKEKKETSSKKVSKSISKA